MLEHKIVAHVDISDVKSAVQRGIKVSQLIKFEQYGPLSDYVLTCSSWARMAHV